VATLRYTARALGDLERLADFLAEADPAGALAILDVIAHGLSALELHPLIGRPAERGLRELVISRGESGYIALYRYLPKADRVNILAIRHQREAGFEEG
jgi:plasmid stabilization system protein ParE